ncbi:Ig-like domain-containing protein [Candidatus Enterococcus mansonii]|uniref:Serine protease n=1 Tax=Candidatus Enterococcus mansonii TaxID=1834181 RepID=A0A242CFG9_9ENTE|nr:Ig-like domain-containing protein [Enterococcus sp. 4G2_DIV0659]OTO08956.1 hypothetical protein A5880_001956 [Enterococcus sp. 4G2_DIV0659]
MVPSQSQQAWGIENRSIIGTDDRIQVTDTTLSPYQSTVFIAANGGLGSGSVIGKDTVLTAAHVVNKIKDNPTADTNYVIPGRNGATLPFGKFKIKEINIHQKYLSHTDSNHDIAVITLEQSNGKSIGDLVKQNRLSLTNEVTLGNAVSTMGYPGDKPWGTMWESKGQIIGQNENIIKYDFDTKGGQSGSPVFNEQNEIIAVHTSGSTVHNNGVKLNSEHLEFISKHIGESSNSFNEVTDIQVDKEVVELAIGESVKINATVMPENATNKQLFWDTTAEQIAVVDQDGTITGTGEGTTVIDVLADNKKVVKYIIVTVTKEIEPKEIVVEKEKVELAVGETMTLKASVLPEEAVRKELYWISMDEDIATVDDDGNITGLAPGSTELLILSYDGKIEKYITAEIKEKEEPLQRANLTFPKKTGVYFSKQDIKETIGTNANSIGNVNIVLHLNKPNRLYDLKIAELDFFGGTGVYNVQPVALNQPMTKSLYTVNATKKITNSKMIIMYVDKKNPTIVKDYFIVSGL